MDINTLHVKEYEKLTKEISDSLKEVASIEKLSVGFTGAIYAWLLTSNVKIDLPFISFFIPLIVVILLCLLTYGIYERINLIGKYIMDNHEKIMRGGNDASSIVGWETSLDKTLKDRSSFLVKIRKLFWVAQLILNIIVPIVIIFLSKNPC